MKLKMRLRTSAKSALIEHLSAPIVDATARKFTDSFVPILMLHRFEQPDKGISGHSPVFIRQAVNALLKRGYSFIDLDDAVRSMQGKAAPLPAKPVVLTMDDGFSDQAEIGAPLFLELGCPVTCFLITGFLDGQLWPWDDQVRYCIDQSPRRHLQLDINGKNHNLAIDSVGGKSKAAELVRNHMKTVPAPMKDQLMMELAAAAEVQLPASPPEKYRSMSWEQARVLEKRGIKFGPHTISHNILSRQDDESARYEVQQSVSRVSAELASPSQVFCYPTGRKQDFSERDEDNIRTAGCLAAVSTEPGYLTAQSSLEVPFRTPRFGMPDNIDDLLQYCSWIEYAKGKLRGA